jgi:hypothetical protein
MTNTITLSSKHFDQPLAAVNRLADKMYRRTGIKPSIRKLAAEILLEGSQRRIDELNQSRKNRPVEGTQNPAPESIGENT